MQNIESDLNSTPIVTQCTTDPEFVETSSETETQQEKNLDLLSLSRVRLALDTEFVTRDTEEVKQLSLSPYLDKLEEHSNGELLEVLAVSGYSPEFDSYLYSDKFDEDYNPIISFLQQLGHLVKATPIRRGKINELLTKYYKKYKKRSSKKALEALKKDKVLKVELENYGIKLSELKLEIRQKNGKSVVCFRQRTITFELIFFFEYADLFKCWGRNWYWLFKDEALLTQFRTIKMQGISRFSCVVDGVPLDIKIKIFDTRYVFPPRKGSLEGQVKTFGIADKLGNKLKISEAIKEHYTDDVTEQWCKENMDIVKHKYPDIFKDYALQDARLTWELMQTFCEMKSDVGSQLGLSQLPDLRETCGKNIEDFLFGLIEKHFGEADGISSEELKTLSKEINDIYKLGTSKSLSKLYGNDYGVIPTNTVGGLLFTRMVGIAFTVGVLLDLDLSSCYATALTNMTLYIGEPILTTYHFDKPKLRDILEELDSLGVDKDAYFIRVSGRLEKGFNSLLLSDLKFDKHLHVLQDYARYIVDDEVSDEKDTVNLIDAKKPSNDIANCKLLSKELNHSIVTEATRTALKDLPKELLDEYLNLDVDAVCYYHPGYIFDTVSELKEAIEKLPEHPVTEEMGSECLKITRKQVYKNNACLRFPMAKYYEDIKKVRDELKAKKVPIQEIYKLILNSTYGILASVVMKSNNPVAANWITSCARAASWRMVLSLNGFSPITDGSSFDWLHVPTNETLEEILSKNPRYLIEFDGSINNTEDITNYLVELLDSKPNTKGFNGFYKDNLKRFLQKEDWLMELFDYELKDEQNRLIFHSYYNTGAGNYVKEGDWGESFKCRSYQEVPELVEWFKESCGGEYKEHIIFLDREIIKLSQGSIDATRIVQDASSVHFDEKFKLGMLEDTAFQICDEGISHPMGFAKDKFKLMKLISASQFVCEDVRQYKAIASLCACCGSISKQILLGNWMSELDLDFLGEFKAYGTNGRVKTPDVDENLIKHYHQMNKQSPVGLGLELLIYGSKRLKSLTDVRQRINDLLREYKVNDKGILDLKNQLHFTQRIIPKLLESKYLKHLLAATVILKTRAKVDYIQLLANSTIDPMQRVVFLGDIKQLKYESKPHWS